MESSTYSPGIPEALPDEMSPLRRQITEVMQRVSTATDGYVTLPNIMDAVALPGGIYGAEHFDSKKGIVIAAFSFLTDIVDGPIARFWKVASDKGEIFDAAGDKIKIAFALYKMWQLDIAPKSLIAAVAIQNGANVALTAVDRATNAEPVLHPSKFGKKAMLFEECGLGLHVIGTEVAKTNQRRGRLIKRVGTAITMVGLGLGEAATAGYTKTLIAGPETRVREQPLTFL